MFVEVKECVCVCVCMCVCVCVCACVQSKMLSGRGWATAQQPCAGTRTQRTTRAQGTARAPHTELLYSEHAWPT